MALFKLAKRRAVGAADTKTEAERPVEDAARQARIDAARKAFDQAIKETGGDVVYASVMLPLEMTPAERDALFCDPLDEALREDELGRVVGVGAVAEIQSDGDEPAPGEQVLVLETLEDPADEEEALEDGVIVIDLELANAAAAPLAVVDTLLKLRAPRGATLEVHHADGALEEIPILRRQ